MFVRNYESLAARLVFTPPAPSVQDQTHSGKITDKSTEQTKFYPSKLHQVI